MLKIFKNNYILQDQKNERYRLQIVVRELQWALSKGQETADYQTAIVAFINCLIISTPQLRDRIRIRNEFIGKHKHLMINY